MAMSSSNNKVDVTNTLCVPIITSSHRKAMEAHPFPSECHYILLSISPAAKDELTIRKALSDALAQSFGQTCANLTIELLWVKEDGEQCAFRVHEK